MSPSKSMARAMLILFAIFASACAHKKVDAPVPNVAPAVVEVAPYEGQLAILQGMTDEHSTQLAVLVPTRFSVSALLKDLKGGKILEPSTQKRVSRPFSEWAVEKFKFQGLNPNISYTLEIHDDKGAMLDTRELFALDLSKKKLRFLIASCMDDSYVEEQRKIWDDVASQAAQVYFFIGDNVYTDKRINFYQGPAPADTIWHRYVETRGLLRVFRQKRLVPILASWDDHDYGANDSDENFPAKDESKKIFETFFAQETIPGALERGPGVSSIFTGFGQRFILTDDRSFRSPDKVHGAAETHWGLQQEEWIVSRLSRPMPTWLFNGDQMYGGYTKERFESYEGNHPESFKRMMPRIAGSKSTVVFSTGDRHLVEIMKIPAAEFGYDTFEFTTSAIHAKVFPSTWGEYPNPRQVAGVAEKFNYMIAESEAQPDGSMIVDVTGFGPGREVLVKRSEHIQKKK